MEIPWFFFPITFATAATIACARVFRLARQNAVPDSSAVRGAMVIGVSAALAVVPLTIATPIRCNDDSYAPALNIPAGGLGLLGIVAWLAVVAWAYKSAGDSQQRAERSIVILLVGMIVSMAIEYVASSISLEVYCTGKNGGLITQLVVAAIVPSGALLARALGVGTRTRAV